jgi:hypothetical protein
MRLHCSVLEKEQNKVSEDDYLSFDSDNEEYEELDAGKILLIIRSLDTQFVLTE